MIVEFDNDSFVGAGHYRAETKLLVLDLSALIIIRHNLCWDHSFEVLLAAARWGMELQTFLFIVTWQNRRFWTIGAS